LRACNTFAQYGNQDSISLTVQGTYGGTQTLIGLVHVPSDYNTDTITKHPFIIFICGRGSYGTTKMHVQNEGMSNALYTGTWDGTAVNPTNSVTEEFITLSLQHPNATSGIDGRQVDEAVGWLFDHYHGIDTTRGTVTGLSRGGGSACGYLQHIVISNPCTSWTYFHPAHNIPFFIPMSAENNSCDPVDSVFIYNNHVWAFGGDSTGCTDIHGTTTHDLVNHINAVKANLAKFTSYYSSGNGCHSGWDRFYASSYTSSYVSDVYNFSSINIYQAALLYISAVFTGSISGSPFCVSDTVGASVSVPFTSPGTYNSGNVFKAQLSTATGSFGGLILIGTDTSTVNSGTINCIIPPGTPTGTGYRIRVNSTDPHYVGIPSSTSITINLARNSIAPTADQNIIAGMDGDQLTVTEQSTPDSRRWKYGTTLGNYNHAITGATGIHYRPNFANPNTYYVICKSFYSCDSIYSNPVKIIVSASFAKNNLQYNSSKSITFTVREISGQVTCDYSLLQKGKVTITIYDEYGRAYAGFNENKTTGSYTHTFNRPLPQGLYTVTLEYNQQKFSRRLLVTN
jgi:hypothetical protein